MFIFIVNKNTMVEQSFNKILTVGELDFTVSGVYIELDEIEVIFETTTVMVLYEHKNITIDAENIITSLDAWGRFEELIIGEFNDNDGSYLNIDDINEEDILGDEIY